MGDERLEKDRRWSVRLDYSGMMFFQIAISTEQFPSPLKGVEPGGERQSAHIKNLGSHGCCLNVDQPLKRLQVIKMDFPVAPPGITIPTLAEVRWIQKEAGSDQNRVGLRYLL